MQQETISLLGTLPPHFSTTGTVPTPKRGGLVRKVPRRFVLQVASILQFVVEVRQSTLVAWLVLSADYCGFNRSMKESAVFSRLNLSRNAENAYSYVATKKSTASLVQWSPGVQYHSMLMVPALLFAFGARRCSRILARKSAGSSCGAVIPCGRWDTASGSSTAAGRFFRDRFGKYI